MSTNRGYVKFFGGAETRAYATCNTPGAILQGLLKALEHHGISREQIEASVDIAKMEAAFDAIDQTAFRKLLNAIQYHPVQVVLVEATDRHPPGSMAPTSDMGTLLGPVGF